MEEMNEVHEFMDKFHNDVETKWGMAVDDSLGSKVKITLLATGFGLKNVPGMPENKWEPEPETEERDLERIEKVYGQSNDKTNTQRRPNIFIFDDDMMDNNDTIAMVENTPTHKRTKEELKKIQEKNTQKEDTNGHEEPVSNHIVF